MAEKDGDRLPEDSARADSAELLVDPDDVDDVPAADDPLPPHPASASAPSAAKAWRRRGTQGRGTDDGP